MLTQKARLLGLTLAMALGSLVAAPPSQADLRAFDCSGFDDPFAMPLPDTCVSLGNNFTHTYQFASVRSDIATSFTVAMGAYDATDLTVHERVPGDVVVQDNQYGSNNLVGWVNCDPATATQGGTGTRRWCYGQDLRFNLTYPFDFDTVAERRDIACHEFGHTVGLRHVGSTATCMNNDNSWGGNSTVDATERNEINAQYNPY